MLLSLAGRPLDLLYSRLGGLNGSFFRDGWGNLGIVDLQQDVEIVSQWPPAELQVRRTTFSSFTCLLQTQYRGFAYLAWHRVGFNTLVELLLPQPSSWLLTRTMLQIDWKLLETTKINGVESKRYEGTFRWVQLVVVSVKTLWYHVIPHPLQLRAYLQGRTQLLSITPVRRTNTLCMDLMGTVLLWRNPELKGFFAC
jgi:hypothetical protein